MNKGQLITNIGDWMNRTAGELNDIISQEIIESQFELESEHPFWFLIDDVQVPIVSGNSYVIVPDCVISLKGLYLTASGSDTHYPMQIQSYPVEMLNKHSTSTGRPRDAVIEGHIVFFNPTADGNYTLHAIAYHHLDRLDDDTDSNIWTTDYVRALRLKALINLEAFIDNDARINTWATLLRKTLEQMRAEAAQMQLSDFQEIRTDNEDIYY